MYDMCVCRSNTTEKRRWFLNNPPLNPTGKIYRRTACFSKRISAEYTRIGVIC